MTAELTNLYALVLRPCEVPGGATKTIRRARRNAHGMFKKIQLAHRPDGPPGGDSYEQYYKHMFLRYRKQTFMAQLEAEKLRRQLRHRDSAMLELLEIICGHKRVVKPHL